MKSPAIAATLDTMRIDLLLAASKRIAGDYEAETYFLALGYASWWALVEAGTIPEGWA